MPLQATILATVGYRSMQERASLRMDQCGATMVEFAVLAPVFLAMLMAAFNLGQMSYGQALLNGAVQESARQSATEVADPDATDQNVRAVVSRILPGAEFDFDRRSYFDLSDIGRARYHSVTDDEVIEAFKVLTRTEGIIPALEPAHGLAWILREAPSMQGQTVLLNLSGRGDKDVAQMMDILDGDLT